jgi:hypothetical protein
VTVAVRDLIAASARTNAQAWDWCAAWYPAGIEGVAWPGPDPWCMTAARFLAAAPLVAFVGHALGRIAQALLWGLWGISLGWP